MSSKGLANGWGVYSNDTATAGTSANPWAIRDLDDLNAVNTKLTSGAYFRLMDDIDCSTGTFTTIGTSSTGLKGNFDGNGHYISNITNTVLMYADVCAISKLGVTDVVASGRPFFQLIECNASEFTADQCYFGNFTSTGNESTNGSSCFIRYNWGRTSSFVSNCVVKDVTLLDYTDTSCFCKSTSKCIALNVNTKTHNVSPSDEQSALISRFECRDSIVIGGSITVEGTPMNPNLFGRVCQRQDTTVNCYASDTITSNKLTWTSDKNGGDGETVTATQYHDKRFYDGTGIDGTVYLDWDFDDIWYWDEISKLPRLRAFLPTKTSEVYVYDGGWKKAKDVWVTDADWRRA